MESPYFDFCKIQSYPKKVQQRGYSLVQIIQGLLFRKVSLAPQGALASMPLRGWEGETVETPTRICRLNLETHQTVMDTRWEICSWEGVVDGGVWAFGQRHIYWVISHREVKETMKVIGKGWWRLCWGWQLLWGWSASPGSECASRCSPPPPPPPPPPPSPTPRVIPTNGRGERHF